MANIIIDKEELAAKLTETLVAFLQEKLGEDFNEYISTLLPAVINLAVTEGTAAAEAAIIGLTSDNSQPYWEALIRAASPETRLNIMETTRQRAIRDTLDLIKRKEAAWTVFKTALSIVITLLASLL